MNSDSKACRHLETHFPGFRVIAGPFDVEPPSVRWKAERRRCLKAVGLLRTAGVESKIVMWRKQAYVLRTAKGWREVGSLSTEAGGQGLFCPLCKYGPYRHERALRLHRCLLLPKVNYGHRIMGGRLDNEHIRQAVEAAAQA